MASGTGPGLGLPITIRADSGGGGGGGVGGSATLGANIGGGFYKRETYRLRDADDLDKDMSDYQRSLSEGRLVDSDISRDGLSQSHDSVFSESAGTASSLSITLKNELADVLRKRRKDRQNEASDEDLGLPQSPITPQRKERGINKSEGSLSILSMTSSDLDLEERSGSNASGHNLLHLDSSGSSSMYNNRSSSDGNDDNGADSPASKLSHSAAKHKLAVRPKKKGPTRARPRTREPSVLPATPEVNEESLKLSSNDISTHLPLVDSHEEEEKCHSLPFVVNSGPMMPHPVMTGSSSTTIINKSPGKESTLMHSSNLSASMSLAAGSHASNTAIYVNRNISKSYDFKGLSNGKGQVGEEGDFLGGGEKKEDDGFFKRILNYSFKKKKHDHGSRDELMHSGGPVASPRKEDNRSTVYITSNMTVAPDQLGKLSLPVNDDGADLNGYKKIKAGPAARQRIYPKEIFGNEVDSGPVESHRYSSNVEVNRRSTCSTGSGSIVINGGDQKMASHKSEEYLVSNTRKFSERSFDDEDDEEIGRKYQPNVEKVKNPKIYGLSPYQQRIAKISVNQGDSPTKDSPTKRRAVEKSKSFRVYSDTVSNQLTNANNLPSLPNLTNSLSIGNFTNNFLETEHKFFSMTENINKPSQKIFKDYITNVDQPLEEGRMTSSTSSLQKFEINDNNLLNPREQEHVDHQPKSIVLTSNALAPPEPNSILHKSNQNISQIEENIDKLVSSPFVSIIKDATGSSDRLDQPEQTPSSKVPEFMKIQLNRVETARLKANVVLTTAPQISNNSAGSTPTPTPSSLVAVEEPVKTRRFSNENIEITESKPPLPPSAVTVAANRNSLIEGPPRSPPAFKRVESNSKRNSINLTQEISDDRKVILQRRTSVTEEKIKYERRISSSSEDIKIERKKSGSEELLEKRNSTNYNSGSSSGDELVVLRKKSILDNFKDKDKDTPELMKVFARRSLKLRSDEDYRTGETKVISNVDSDKENQSSEEKLDKLVKSEGNGQKGGNGNVVAKEPSESKVNPENNANEAHRKSISKPFGMPNRFGNSANVQPRNASSFVELRKSLINGSSPTNTPPANANTKNGLESNEPPVNNGTSNNTNGNNNTANNRHTIATMNQFNLNANNNNNTTICGNPNSNTGTIETIGESNEFKGILQRRAEWEKRAKEGFK
ncbi:probable serine/threonine-protein kinase DDB_G0282963 isoform X2 [Uranotaenia lowii]|nr:probable serine/threonine-protein kinase DDB_G0282963 isoform X2 [Uranotaenia lowii]